MLHNKILIFDFGSQFTQLIARRIRELNVYCEIVPYNAKYQDLMSENIKGIVLSGSPFSVLQENALEFPVLTFIEKYNLPVLGVCYGAQYLAKTMNGAVEKSSKREYGRANINILQGTDLLKGIPQKSQVWMSHGDSIIQLPENFELLASTDDIPVAAFKWKDKNIYGIQFHPEVTHSTDGKTLLKNFAVDICGCQQDWSELSFIDETVQELKQTIGNEKVVLGLSGGVDSSVAALLLHKAIGQQLYCIFVNNGLLRYKEYDSVLESYKQLGLNIIGVDASNDFYSE